MGAPALTRRGCGLLALWMLGLACPAAAQPIEPAPAVGDAQTSVGPLSPASGSPPVVGGESRTRFERLSHPSFGREEPDTNGYWLQRTMLRAGLAIAPSANLLVELRSSLVADRRAGPRPSDKDTLDLNQVYVELAKLKLAGRTASLRVGRQEIEYESVRLVTARDGLNDRLSFDGLRLLVPGEAWRWGGWWTRPVITKPGVFDNEPDRGQTFAAAYIGGAHDIGGTGDVAGALALRRIDQARYAQGAGPESRLTYAVHAWGHSRHWDYKWEGGLQRGSFAGARIRAWYVATDTGLTFETLPLRPRFGVRLDAASGDKDRERPELQTFNALFASTAFSGLAGLIGPANARDAAGSVTLQLGPTVSLTAGAARFWRQTVADGVYGIGGSLVTDGRVSNSKQVGVQHTLQATLNLDAATMLSMTISRFAAGETLRAAGLAPSVGLLTAWARLRF